jgi:hypothetical protein
LPSRKVNGVIAALVVLLVLTSAATGYYYYMYTNVSSNNSKLLAELSSANSIYQNETAKYQQLVSNYNRLDSMYNGSIESFEQMAAVYNESAVQFYLLTSTFENLSSGYNSTLSYLVQAVSQLNTTELAYASAKSALRSLWNQYQYALQQYRLSESEFLSLTHRFDALAANFYSQYLNASFVPVKVQQPSGLPLFSYNMLIDFGNGTMIWYNGTSFQPGWNLYQATLVLTGGRVDATWYPQYGEHYVYGIMGVDNTQSMFWFLWSYSSAGWNTTQVGADDIQVVNGSTYAWTYCGMNSQYQPTCTP